MSGVLENKYATVNKKWKLPYLLIACELCTSIFNRISTFANNN